MAIRTPAELKREPALASYAPTTPTMAILPQVTSASIAGASTSHIENLLTGQASTIRKIDHFRAGIFSVLLYELFKITTYFKALSFLTTDETKKVIRDISALDNLTGNIRNTANKVARALNNTPIENRSSSVEDLVYLAQLLASLDRHDFLGSKTAYVEALSNLVENNTAGLLGCTSKVENIEAFKKYLLTVIEKRIPTFSGTCFSTAILNQIKAPEVLPHATNQEPAPREPTFNEILLARQSESETEAAFLRHFTLELRRATAGVPKVATEAKEPQITSSQERVTQIPSPTEIIIPPTMAQLELSQSGTAPKFPATSPQTEEKPAALPIIAPTPAQSQQEPEAPEEDLHVTNERFRARLQTIARERGFTLPSLSQQPDSAPTPPDELQCERSTSPSSEEASSVPDEDMSLLFDRIILFVRFLPTFSEKLIKEKLINLSPEELRTVKLVMETELTPKQRQRVEAVMRSLEAIPQASDQSSAALTE